MNEILASALRYVELGYSIFPCAPSDSRPLTEVGHPDARVAPEQIEQWWTAHPDSNIGLSTAGLVVVEINGRSNPWPGPERGFELVTWPMAATPGEGRLHVFRRPPGKAWRRTQSALAPRVDSLADGCYVVVPPSRRGDGEYRWIEGFELDRPLDQLPEPPDWLVLELDLLSTSSSSSSLVATTPASIDVIPKGQRTATLARLGGAMRRVGMSRSAISADLLQTNGDRCVPPLAAGEVERVAASVASCEPNQVVVAPAEIHRDQTSAARAAESAVELDDPGPLPEELLRIPGFISEVMDHCLQTAPYPNVTMAFCGALALQAFLSGRKARDSSDNRTNLYLLGLAHSASGKDWPRKINARIAHRIGLGTSVGDRFASGEGIQDALFLNPATLFQTDEIDGMLQVINKAKDARYENIMGTLLTMYSAANSVFPMRRKAGDESPGVIDQPCLVIFGTAIPNHYYEALSERMLTNGLFARMLILESGRRGPGQDPVICDPPERTLETAMWWKEFRPGGDLHEEHPAPAVVEATVEARGLLTATRLQAEAEYGRAEDQNDPIGTTVWGRVYEQTRKLALLHAVSVNHRSPVIDAAAARFAERLVTHQTRRMLFMARRHVSDGEFDQRCKRLVDLLADWRRRHGDQWMPFRDISRRLRWSRRDHDEIRDALVDQERVETTFLETAGRPRNVYRLRGQPSAGSA